MEKQNIIYKIKPPCPKCPYKLGIVHTVTNPCPECKANGYEMYEWFLRERSGNYQADN